MPNPTEMHSILTKNFADQIRWWLQSILGQSEGPFDVRGEAYITIVEPNTRRIIHQGVPDIALSKQGPYHYINRVTGEIAFSQTLRDLADVLSFWAQAPFMEGTFGVKVDELYAYESPPALLGLQRPLEPQWTILPGGENHSDGYRWSGPHRISIQVWTAGKRRISAVRFFQSSLVHHFLKYRADNHVPERP